MCFICVMVVFSCSMVVSLHLKNWIKKKDCEQLGYMLLFSMLIADRKTGASLFKA